MPKLVKDLQETLDFVRNIMRCEVLDEKLEDFTLLGLTPEELREQSHYPKKYFGIGHEFPRYWNGRSGSRYKIVSEVILEKLKLQLMKHLRASMEMLREKI